MPIRSLLLWATLATAGPAQAQSQKPVVPDSLLQQLVRDYTALYTRDSFEVWTRLFLPWFNAVSTNVDGTLTYRDLTRFLDAQRQGFLRAREMREELENVVIEQRDRLATVWADFVFHYDGRPSRGKLVLLAVADTGGWRFSALQFAYNVNRESRAGSRKPGAESREPGAGNREPSLHVGKGVTEIAPGVAPASALGFRLSALKP